MINQILNIISSKEQCHMYEDSCVLEKSIAVPGEATRHSLVGFLPGS
jgi:hypothetical protein